MNSLENDSRRNELELRGAALGAISEAAARFLVAGDLATGADETLALLGAALRADYVFALETIPREGTVGSLRMRYSWGVGTEGSSRWAKDEVEPILPDVASSFFERLSKGIFLWGDAEEAEPLPSPLGQRWPGRSFILQPVRAGQGWWGVLGISCRNAEQMFSVARVESLATASRLLGAALTRQRDEEELRRSEERFRGLFEASSDLIQLVDFEGRFLFVNKAWQKALGYTDEEMLNLRQHDVVDPKSKAAFLETFKRMQAGEKQELIETIFICRNGRHLEVEGSSTTEIRKDQRSIRCIFRDVSYRKEIERLQGEFIAMVSHELRTPLTSIQASLYLLAKDLKTDQGRELIKIAQQNSENLNRLVNDIIDLESLEAGRLTFVLVIEDVQELVDRAIETNRAYALRLGITLHVTRRETVLPVWADGNRLCQVLTNLLSNAAKFSKKGTDISVAVLRRGDHARVEIHDSGPGIPADQRDLVFRKFSQLSPVETRRGGGTGLGLSIAKHIMDRLGGKIDFYCPKSGGTVFFLEIPLAEEGGHTA